MDSRAKLVVLLLLAWSGAASAGYAQMTPPPNWTTSAGASAVKVAVNDVSFAGGVRSSSAAVLNVGGRAVSMPAAYRFATNAGRFAAGSAFGNPSLFAALVVGSAGYEAYKWYVDNKLTVEAGRWIKTNTVVGGNEYRATWPGVSLDNDPWYPTAAAAGTAFAPRLGSTVNFFAVYNATRIEYISEGTHFWGDYSTRVKADSATKTVVTQLEMENTMDGKAVPLGVPQVWPVPGVWWPVQPLPIINPTPEPVPKPSPLPVPTPRPMRVPQGDPQAVPLPVPNPDNLPQTWKSPVIDVVPSPTANEPWRVDVQPKDIISTSPSPLPEAEPVPVTPPEGDQVVPEEKPGLCDEYPDILACQKPVLGELEPIEVPNVDKAVAIAMDDGWGPSNGSCPAPKTATVMGVNLSLPFTMLCDFATGIRPLLLGFAWLSASMIFFGFARKN